MNENERAEHFFLKIKERLTIIFDNNLPQGKSIIDSDREVLYELFKLYDNGQLDWLSKEPMEKENTSQGNLFLTGPDTLALTTTTPE